VNASVITKHSGSRPATTIVLGALGLQRGHGLTGTGIPPAPPTLLTTAVTLANVSGAPAIIEPDLKEMQTRVLSEKTLNQAKVLLLQQMPLSESSVQSIADGSISCTKDELPLNEPTDAAHRKLTPGQVQSCVCKVDSSTRLGPSNRWSKCKIPPRWRPTGR
jgi:hypothetical protein